MRIALQSDESAHSDSSSKRVNIVLNERKAPLTGKGEQGECF